MLAALALVFDVTSVLALMYPGRERVEMDRQLTVRGLHLCLQARGGGRNPT